MVWRRPSYPQEFPRLVFVSVGIAENCGFAPGTPRPLFVFADGGALQMDLNSRRQLIPDFWQADLFSK